MPTTFIGVATIWMIALLVPGAQVDSKKLAIHEFNTRAECESNIPYIKRYYRLYGDRWSGKCVQTEQRLPATKLNYGSM
ncbi:MAG: hypothetical protein OEU26_28555 [Candidatus Tectomicrobia bacterium]|nr:hypothetical protein [Candidatus Tectomicrobia bacterium]